MYIIPNIPHTFSIEAKQLPYPPLLNTNNYFLFEKPANNLDLK